jgi:hypothetical protein
MGNEGEAGRWVKELLVENRQRSEGVARAGLISGPQTVGHVYAQKLSKHSERLFL